VTEKEEKKKSTEEKEEEKKKQKSAIARNNSGLQGKRTQIYIIALTVANNSFSGLTVTMMNVGIVRATGCGIH
jgi:hypothetical protein